MSKNFKKGDLIQFRTKRYCHIFRSFKAIDGNPHPQMGDSMSILDNSLLVGQRNIILDRLINDKFIFVRSIVASNKYMTNIFEAEIIHPEFGSLRLQFPIHYLPRKSRDDEKDLSRKVLIRLFSDAKSDEDNKKKQLIRKLCGRRMALRSHEKNIKKAEEKIEFYTEDMIRIKSDISQLEEQLKRITNGETT